MWEVLVFVVFLCILSGCSLYHVFKSHIFKTWKLGSWDAAQIFTCRYLSDTADKIGMTNILGLLHKTAFYSFQDRLKLITDNCAPEKQMYCFKPTWPWSWPSFWLEIALSARLLSLRSLVRISTLLRFNFGMMLELRYTQKSYIWCSRIAAQPSAVHERSHGHRLSVSPCLITCTCVICFPSCMARQRVDLAWSVCHASAVRAIKLEVTCTNRDHRPMSTGLYL